MDPVAQITTPVVEKKKRAKRTFDVYRPFVRKLIKSLDPAMRLSNHGQVIIDGMLQDVFHKISRCTDDVAVHKYMHEDDIATACHVVFTKQLAERAIARGDIAFAKYQNSKPPKKEKKKIAA